MNREDILAKAQQEKEDELQVQIRDRSIRWTYLVMVLMAFAFALVKGQRGEVTADLCATVCASVAAGQLYRYVKLKDTFHLVLGLLVLAVAVFGVIRFCMAYYG